MEVDKSPAFDLSANDASLTKSKKKKKKDKNLDIGEKQAESTFRVEPSEKPVEVSFQSRQKSYQTRLYTIGGNNIIKLDFRLPTRLAYVIFYSL